MTSKVTDNDLIWAAVQHNNELAEHLDGPVLFDNPPDIIRKTLLPCDETILEVVVYNPYEETPVVPDDQKHLGLGPSFYNNYHTLSSFWSLVPFTMDDYLANWNVDHVEPN
ncbi:MAG: hypothetical protein Unbinned1190contig1000_23 [Prokaryotic dsDNA virus sp.]|nr:MAG: hypothetical protein Unbinned1190contig1000_23 [Prokaryotic dsDNA virus sp.]|tara:strand:+ start:12197 stop:12529 length:333 start_codon:yes stop_codon:yes gene_type:complete